MDCGLPGSSVHGILQARILEWGAISSSRGSSQPRDRTHMSCIAGRFFKPLSRQGSPLSAVLVADHPSEVLCRTSPCLGTEGDFNRDLLPAYYPQHPAQPKLLREQR